MATSSRLRTASMVAAMPSRASLSATCLTSSGRWRAVLSRFAPPASTSMRSVPGLINDHWFWTSSPPPAPAAQAPPRRASRPSDGIAGPASFRLRVRMIARRSSRELEADHELLEGVEDAQGQAGAAVEEAASQDVHVHEQGQRLAGHPRPDRVRAGSACAGSATRSRLSGRRARSGASRSALKRAEASSVE